MLRHLSQRLVIPLTVIVVVVAVFSVLYTTSGEERQMLRMMSEGADQLSRSITSATWHAMLADRRQDAYQVMDTIAQKEGIDHIRMFNRNGLLTFSTKPEEIRHQTDRSLETCSGCHASSLPLQEMDLAARTQIFRKPGGGRSLDMITPIYNEPSCSQAECHAHPASDKVLGLVDVQLSLANVDSELATMRMRVIVRALVEFVLISVFILVFTRRFVSRPLQQLVEGAQAISQMDLDRPIQAADGSVEIDAAGAGLRGHAGESEVGAGRDPAVHANARKQGGGAEPATADRRSRSCRTATGWPRWGSSRRAWRTRSITRSRACST